MGRRWLMALAFAGVAGPANAEDIRPERPASAALEGLWSGASYTELERPEGLASLVLTPQQALNWENKLHLTGGINTGEDAVGQTQSEFPETGSALLRVRGEIRSSVIVDPADGKLPYTRQAKADIGLEPSREAGYDNVEDRPQDERCLASDTAGAPSVPTADANVVQIIEAPGYVVILAERYHDARIIPLTQVRDPRWTRSWLGDSIGWWEGATLVVETSNHRPGLTKRADKMVVSAETRVVERFTRTSPTEIHYGFSVTDPYLYTRTWRGEYVFTPASALFEYACHEGNYSIINILTAARLGRQDTPAAAKPTP